MPDSTAVVFVDCGPWFGGAQRSLLTLASGLRDAGYGPVLLVADATAGGLLEQAREQGLAVHQLAARHWRKGPSGLFQFLVDRRRCVPLIRRVIDRHSARLVHANGVRAALLACPASPPGTPVVVHARDVREPPMLRRWIAQRARMVIAISGAVAAQWQQPCKGRCQVETIHNGFDLDKLAGAARAPGFPWQEQHVTATVVADMARWKRHDLFLDAVHEAHGRDPRVRGIIVGRALNEDGRRWQQVLRTQAAALALDELVAFVPDAQDALPWIAASDVLLSTADNEPFGRTLVEALVLGKPVVAVRGGGPAEIVGTSGAGLVVEPTPTCLADAILSLADPERHERASQAARRRAKDFSARRMVDRVHELYGRLLRRQTRACG